MGAVAPPPYWLPEDDVLLKNAVEAGASIESLAKGAVQFSRRYSIQELQDRWFSLLYDPVVSEEASVHMIELDHSASTYQSRPNRSESLKELRCGSRKRKAESIRNFYYAMRKRIRNEPIDMDFSFPCGPTISNFREGIEPLAADCLIGNPVSSNLGIQVPDFDIQHHSLPEVRTRAAETNCRVSPSSLTNCQNYGPDLHHGGKEMTHNFYGQYEEHIFTQRDDIEVQAFDQSKELPFGDLFEAEGLGNGENACPDFGGPPFPSFECSPSLPQLPIWSASQDMSAANLPIQLGENGQLMEDNFMLPQTGGANEAEALRCGAQLTSNFEAPVPCDAMRHLTPSAEDYFAELSGTLFDLTNEDDILFMDTEGKDTIDKSYLDGFSSLLLDSPNGTGLLNVGVGETEDGHFLDVDVTIPPQGSENEGLNHIDQDRVPEPHVQSSESTPRVFGPEYHNGVICCVLNTEDPEIPSNDDVFLPYRFPSPSKSSGSYSRFHDPIYPGPLLVDDFSGTHKIAIESPVIKRTLSDSCGPSRVMEKSRSSDMSFNCPTGDYGVKFELPKSNIQHAALRNPRTSECPKLNSSGNESTNNLKAGFSRGDTVETEWGKNLGYRSAGPCLDKHPRLPDSSQILQNSVSNSRNEFDTKDFPDVGPSNRENLAPRPIDDSLMPDQDELCSDNDFDVPHFSDVEAMILDMDLSPDEFDLGAYPEVQRYKHEETKRTIIRLEQGADAGTQRALAARGAFALLYGRHSRHFIKKPEVVLGRSTEDVKVDIDLGRERNGGKISRRQASITMDMNGSFHLKNLGKCSIYVNGVEVVPGLTRNLASGCLIEIRGLGFVFETNPSRVKHHSDSAKKETIFLDQKPLVGS